MLSRNPVLDLALNDLLQLHSTQKICNYEVHHFGIALLLAELVFVHRKTELNMV